MAHFGGISNVGHTHVRILAAFGRELERRGHRFTMFQSRFIEPLVSHAGVSFCRIPGDDEGIEVLMERMGREDGVSLTTYPEYMRLSSLLLCQQGPDILRSAGVDCLLVDQEEPGGSTAAEIAGIPFATICSSLPLNQERGMPPGFLPWGYRREWWAQLRNSFGYRVRDFVIRRVFKTVNEQRRLHGLCPYSRPDDSFSKQVQISQLIPDFDFPRKSLPKQFHYVGPFLRGAEGPAVPFPFERLDGRPLVYVYYGGDSEARRKVVRQVAAACAGMNVQVVISLEQKDRVEEFDGDPIVVDFAPQQRILAAAALAICHGGFSTTMESLAAGVPLLVIPFHGDQPGVGVRVTYTGVGETLSFRNCGPDKLRPAINSLLTSGTYRARARAMQEKIAKTRGIKSAVDLIEPLLQTRRSVALRGRGLAVS